MASSDKKVFRQVSLERLSSPEQLDQLMQVTSPRGWLALGAMCLLLAVAVAWGFLGSIPTTANGEGILIRQGGVTSISAASSGQMEEILVSVGDVIEEGQVLAKIRQEGIERQIIDAEARLEEARDDLERYGAYVDEQKRLTRAKEAQQRADFERSLRTLERQLELLEENLAVQQSLLADGLVTQQTILESEQRVNTTRDQIASERLELNGLELERLRTTQTLDQEADSRRDSVQDAELALRELRATLDESVRIVASEGGRVLELLVGRGDIVDTGTPILSMEVAAEKLVAVIFVPADLGKQIEPGMETRVIPTIVKPEEHGFITGEVDWVAEFPSTSRGMQRLLANEELVDKLMAQGPPIQVDVTLIEDPSTTSGFRWSSSRGPDIEISSGTLAGGSIIVRRDRPVSLVVPKVLERLGING